MDMDSKFGFLLDIKSLCHEDVENLKKKCKHLGDVYYRDVAVSYTHLDVYKRQVYCVFHCSADFVL